MTRRVLAAAFLIVVVQAAMIGLVSQISKSSLIIPVLYLVILAPIPVCLHLLKMKNIPVRFMVSVLWMKKWKRA